METEPKAADIRELRASLTDKQRIFAEELAVGAAEKGCPYGRISRKNCRSAGGKIDEK